MFTTLYNSIASTEKQNENRENRTLLPDKLHT